MCSKLRSFIKSNYYYFVLGIVSIIDIVCFACEFHSKLVLMISAAIVALLFVVLNEVNSFYIVLFLLPFRCLENVPIFKTVGYISLVCILFSIVLSVKYLIKLITKKEKLLVWPFVLSIVLMLLGFVNFDYKNYLDLLMNWLLIATFYVMFVDYKKVKTSKACFSMFTGLVLSLAVSAGFYLIPSLRGQVLYYDRFIALAGDPNALQLICTTLIACSVCLYHNKKLNAILFYSSTAIAALTGLLTKSKAFFVCVALTVAVHLIILIVEVYKERKKQVKILELGLMLIILSVAMFVFKEQIYNIIDRFKQTNYEGILNKITTGRVDIWLTYLKHWASSVWYILFGVGITASPLLPVAHCHNDFIYSLYSYGIVGVAIVVALIISYLHSVKNKKLRFKLVNILPVVLICMLAMIECVITSLLFKFLFMLAVGMIFVSRQKDSNSLIQNYIYADNKAETIKSKEVDKV